MNMLPDPSLASNSWGSEASELTRKNSRLLLPSAPLPSGLPSEIGYYLNELCLKLQGLYCILTNIIYSFSKYCLSGSFNSRALGISSAVIKKNKCYALNCVSPPIHVEA